MYMEVNQVLHMNGGAGEDSYANNSTVQNDILSITKPYTEKALTDLLSERATTSEGKMGIADLGCSSGPNALAAVAHALETVHALWQRNGGLESMEVVVYLNDLPGNDFNNVFVALPEFLAKMRKKSGFGPCLVFGAPGSFHGRLFSRQSLHFVHSSSSLHWLSQLPVGLEPNTRPTLNKGKINISKTSSKEVVDAYTKMFQYKFTTFLDSRSIEVVAGGRMVLSFMGRASIELREDEDSYLQWELIARSLMSMVKEGIVEEEKVDSFNTPYYAASREEIKHLVQTQGSFEIDQLQPFEISWDRFHQPEPMLSEPINDSKKLTRGEKIARIHRAVIEPILVYHFGESIMEELFDRYTKMLDSCLSLREPKFVNLIITLVRKPH